jgi:FlaG/FlaF family flagellin (archaellin)
VRRAAGVVAVAVVLVAAGCSGGGSSGSAGSDTAPPSSTLPVSGTVTYKDGKVYTVAPLGAKLALDDVSVKIDGVAWVDRLGAPLPPGMTTFGVVRLTITNTSGVAQTLTPTQIWLLDSKNHAFLASVAAQIDHPLIGITIPPGKSATGTLAFPAPGRETGNLLVYRFADSTAIAHARHVGLIRYG